MSEGMNRKRVPFSVIERASQGALDAVSYIVRYYQRLICSTTCNEYVRMEMEDELVRGILKFQIRIG